MAHNPLLVQYSWNRFINLIKVRWCKMASVKLLHLVRQGKDAGEKSGLELTKESPSLSVIWYPGVLPLHAQCLGGLRPRSGLLESC